MAHTLLLADDSPTIQRVVELTFAGEDIRIVAVGNGQQAIERLSDDPPDIVLADIAMPLLDGYAVASFVRNHDALRDVPVLLMAGAFDPIDEDRVQASGAAGVLVKPFEPTLVISRVKELLGLARSEPASAAPDIAAEPSAGEPSSEGLERAAAGAGPAKNEEPQAAVASAAPDAEAPEAPASGSPIAEFEREWLDGPAPASAPPAQSPAVSQATPPADPGVEALWAEVAAGSGPAAPTQVPVTFASAPPAASVADAFSALLAAEQGEPVALPSASAVEPAEMDALVEQVTARVLEQLGTAAVRERADRIVAEVAERLVREEIARIRERAAARG